MSTKQNPTTNIIAILGLIGLMWFGCNRCNACLDQSSTDMDRLRTENPKEWRKRKIDQLVDPDGSVDEAEDIAATMLKDPTSFKHIATTVTDNGEVLVVSMRFSGTNSFGGVAQHSVIMTMDLDGKLIEIVDKN